MKQLVFSVFSVILVIQVFLGTTGIIVHEHHCKKEGTSRSFFIAQKHERDQVREVKSCDKSSCCSSKQKVSEDLPFVKKETCCTNSTDFIQLDSDLALDNHGVNSDVLSFSALSEIKSFWFIETVITTPNYRGPPPLITSQRLAILQSYLI
jgi:hypothetical protein